MSVYIVGSGKLASAILSADISFPSGKILKWESNYQSLTEKAILIHAGSGRQLPECISFCQRTDSVLIELSTGLETEKMIPDFTLIVCPNTSILLLKILNVVKNFGHYFEDNKVSILESHQSAKTSEPGTAYAFAHSLKFPIDKIHSIRDPELQRNEIGIPEEFLHKHAYHKIVIEDGSDQVVIETKALGHQSYASGLKRIINAVLKNSFEKRRYTVLELIEQNLI